MDFPLKGRSFGETHLESNLIYKLITMEMLQKEGDTAQMKLPPGGAQHAWKCSQWHVEVISGRTQVFNNFPQVRPSESDFQIKLSERKRATQSDAC